MLRFTVAGCINVTKAEIRQKGDSKTDPEPPNLVL
jgi:hypothetical protein